MGQKYIAIDPVSTGRNIKKTMLDKGLKVLDLQHALYIANPQAIYKWFRGETLPSIDSLYALSRVLNVTMDELIVPFSTSCSTNNKKQLEVQIHD